MSYRLLAPWVLLLSLMMTSSHSAAQSVEEFDADAMPQDVHDSAALDQAAAGIIRLTNEFRRQHDLEPLKQDADLTAVAKKYSQVMAELGESGHRVDDTKPSERAAAEGYEFCIVLENVGFVLDTAGFDAPRLQKKLMEGWKNSEGHRRNLIDPDVTEIGVALARRDETGGYYATQMFGRPKTKQIVFGVTNLSDQEIRYATTRGDAEKEFVLKPRQRQMHHRCRPSQIRFPERRDAPTIEIDSQTNYLVQSASDEAIEIRSQPLPTP